MNSILDSYDPLARMLLQGLLNSLLPGGMLLTLVWILLRVIGRTSATTRHAIWLVSLFTIIVLPFLPTATYRKVLLPTLIESAVAFKSATPLTSTSFNDSASDPGIPLDSILFDEEKINNDEAQNAQKDIHLPRFSVVDSPITWSSRVFDGGIPVLLATVWLVIASLMLGRIVWSYFFLFRLRRCLSLVEAERYERGCDLACTFGIRRKVRFVASPFVNTPLTIGWSRPLVILPSRLLHRLSAADFDSIVAHELAHIKRWDYVTNLAQRLAQALFFFHPAIWVIDRQLSVERELACDDWAVKVIGEPHRYASCLTKLVELVSDIKPLAIATGIIFGKSLISRRIEMILNRDRNATTTVSKIALCSAISTTGLAIVLCSLLSPVIAIPLAQTQAQNKAPRPSSVMPTTVAEVPEPPKIALANIANLSDPPALPEAPLPPNKPMIELFKPLPPISPASWPALPPAPPSMWAFDEKKMQPAIPENELLATLSEIVKRDNDPNVRAEALRGISRIRTDAGINTLIQIYDTLQDAKEKQLVIRYLGYNRSRKAIDKLIHIAKTDADPAVRRSAIRSIYAIDSRLNFDLPGRELSELRLDPKRFIEVDKLREHAAAIQREFANKREAMQRIGERHREEMKQMMEKQRELINKVKPEIYFAPRANPNSKLVPLLE